MPRYYLHASASALAHGKALELDDRYLVEQLTEEHADEAAALLVAAYAESDDPEPAELNELELYWSREWGAPIPSATFCARRTSDLAMASLSVVCDNEEGPLIAHVGTLPGDRRRGLGSHLIGRSAAALGFLGRVSVNLAAAAENRPALKLYARLGFRFSAPGALEGDAIWYRDPEHFESVTTMIRHAWGVDDGRRAPSRRVDAV